MQTKGYRSMTEADVTRVAVETIFRDFIGNQPAVAPTSEVADEGGLKPDRIIVALDNDLDIEKIDEIESDNLVIHTVESKVDRRYLVGPDFSGVAQASDYWGNYNWLAVAEDADLDEEEWGKLVRACTHERIGFIVCGWKTGVIRLEPGYDDTEHFTHYPCWDEVFEEFCARNGFHGQG